MTLQGLPKAKRALDVPWKDGKIKYEDLKRFNLKSSMTSMSDSNYLTGHKPTKTAEGDAKVPKNPSAGNI